MASNPYEQFLIPSDSNQQTAVATDQGGAVGPSGEQLNLPPNTGAENIAGGIPAAVTDNPYSQFLQSQQQQQALPQSDPNDLTSNYTQSVPQATPQDNTKDNPYAQFLQPTPTPIHVQEQTGPVINLPALPPKEQTVFDQALNQYPQLQKAGAVGLISTETPDGENKLESWQPKDEGTKDRPRPKELPNEKLGVQIFSKDTTPEDVAADIVSHSLVKTDPTLKATYDQFASSLTPYKLIF